MTSTDGLTSLLDVLQAALDDPEVAPVDLAARAHLSRFHFDRLVAAATGEPPGVLRRRLLLERAAHRLVTSDRTVLDIAVEAGYGSHEAFTRAFRRSYGFAPTAVRRRRPLTFRELELPCPSGVHFQPPGGLRLPAARQETPMNVLQSLVDHHVQTLTAIIDRAAGLDDQVLDRPVTVSVATIDEQPTLRSLVNAMVTQEEHWLSALRGGEWPDESDRSMTGLAARHAVAGRDWQTFVARTLADGTLADTFVDTTCTPPTTHTLGGTIGHVITFAAVRRTMAIGALRSAGVTDLGAGDPRPYLDRVARATTD
ncbi:helix-turn-helix domain-containing protein [Micromonospora sp. DT227]|uniref:helix-turn-helix domain-containing protein n=1 Tax=Micromonospora sp. DT227 TaxID=3393433 RepID=UPI003CF9B8D0